MYKSEASKGPNSVITGDLLIIVAQVISACQMVYEEKYVAGKRIFFVGVSRELNLGLFCFFLMS